MRKQPNPSATRRRLAASKRREFEREQEVAKLIAALKKIARIARAAIRCSESASNQRVTGETNG